MIPGIKECEMKSETDGQSGCVSNHFCMHIMHGYFRKTPHWFSIISPFYAGRYACFCVTADGFIVKYNGQLLFLIKQLSVIICKITLFVKGAEEVISAWPVQWVTRNGSDRKIRRMLPRLNGSSEGYIKSRMKTVTEVSLIIDSDHFYKTLYKRQWFLV